MNECIVTSLFLLKRSVMEQFVCLRLSEYSWWFGCNYARLLFCYSLLVNWCQDVYDGVDVNKKWS